MGLHEPANIQNLSKILFIVILPEKYKFDCYLVYVPALLASMAEVG